VRSIPEYIPHPLSNHRLQRRKAEIKYVRLNPVGGLATIDLAQFTRGADIEAITNQYLEIPEVADQVENFAASIQVVSRTVWQTMMYLTD
jgi:response regulator RpfG family c-di-GMP phosphodiesterase